MTGLDMTREYLVLVVVDDVRNATGLRIRQDPHLGRVVRLFSSRETLDAYLQYSDDNQRFMGILEQDDIPEHLGSEDLNLGCYARTTLSTLSPILEAYEVDYLQVDPLSSGGWNRLYAPPQKG